MSDEHLRRRSICMDYPFMFKLYRSGKKWAQNTSWYTSFTISGSSLFKVSSHPNRWNIMLSQSANSVTPPFLFIRMWQIKVAVSSKLASGVRINSTLSQRILDHPKFGEICPRLAKFSEKFALRNVPLVALFHHSLTFQASALVIFRSWLNF